MAAVRETPEGLERLDVAPEHWGPFDKSHLLAFWQTVMPAAEEKKKVFVDDEVLCTLFERLAEATEPAKLHFRFVLGLILMRKRLVIYESARRERAGEGDGSTGDGSNGAKDVWVVRMKGRDDRLDLIDPKLNEEPGAGGQPAVGANPQRGVVGAGEQGEQGEQGKEDSPRRHGGHGEESQGWYFELRNLGMGSEDLGSEMLRVNVERCRNARGACHRGLHLHPDEPRTRPTA